MQKNINFIKKKLDNLKLHELMVTDQGTKSFKVYREFKGKPVRVILGKYPEMTIEN